MKKRRIGFGVVGLGMGIHHCRAICAARGARLAAVCDKHPERLAATMREFGCQGYLDYAEMLKNPEIDVVNIVTESGNHSRMGIAAAKAGKHLIMEKPVDVSPARISALEKAVAAAGVACGCIFQSRLSACNVALKKAIDAGKMGRLYGLHGSLPWYRGPEYYAGEFGHWRGTWELDGGGSLMNQGIHTLDLMIFFGGPVRRVCGFFGVFDHAIEAEDQTVACLEFANGALGTLYVTTCAKPEQSQTIYAFGSDGSFRKQGENLVLYAMGTHRERARMLETFGGATVGDAAARDPMSVSADGHTLIVEDMVQAILRGREPIIPLAQARHAVDVACAAYRAARTGRTVAVSAEV